MLPYAISRLGEDSFGVFQLARSALVFLTYLNFGMAPALIRYFSRAVAEEDTGRVRRIASSAQLILGSFASVGAIVAFSLIPFFVRFYDVSPELVFDTSVLLACMVLSFLMTLISIVPQGMVLAKNRYDVSNGIETITHLFRLGLIVALFESIQPSLLLLGIALLATQLFRFVAVFCAAVRQVGLRPLVPSCRIDREMIRSLLGFGALNFTNTVMVSLALQGSVLVIGKIHGNEAVTAFAPALLIAATLQGVVFQMSSPLVPLAAKDRVKNEGVRIGRWSILIGQASCCIGLGLVLPFCVYGHELIGYWLGFKMASIWPVVAILAFGMTLSAVQTTNYNLALGGGNIRPLVYSQVVYAVVALLCVALGSYYLGWHLLGIAVCLAVCRCIRNVLYVPIVCSRYFSFDIVHYARDVYAKPLLMFALVLAAAYGVRLAAAPGTVLLLCLETILVMVVYYVGCWMFLLAGDTKDAVRGLLVRSK